MMRTWCRSLLLVSVIISASSCGFNRKSFDPAKKYSPAALKEDFIILKQTLEANHPGLYWYTTRDSLDRYFEASLNSISDSLTHPQFRNKVAWWVNKIHCGHTGARYSKAYTDYYNKQKLPQFPLYIKAWKDSAVVINSLLKNDSVFKRGTIITSINSYSTKQLIDSMCSLLSTDGFTKNFNYQAISFNFPAYYRNTFGIDSQYTIRYIDSTGKRATRIIRNYVPVVDTADKKVAPVGGPLSKKQLRLLALASARTLKIDSATKTAFLSVNTFSKGKLQQFFRKSFREIRKDNIRNVVVDLRLNSGGNVMSSTRLTQYLANKPFHVADTVAAVSRSFRGKEHIKPWFWYWLSMNITGKRMRDGRVHYRYFETHEFKPKRKNHFDGNIYIVTGGYTFSASTLVVNNLEGQKNVMLVGEETGGGSYGNNAIHIPSISLPNSGVRVTLPLFRVVLDADRKKSGRGFFPAIEVPPSSDYISRGVDAKLEKVRELIRQGK